MSNQAISTGSCSITFSAESPDGCSLWKLPGGVQTSLFGLEAPPCQPFSGAGKNEGFGDKRHLWPAWLKLIRKCRPNVIAGEQVASAIGHGWLDLVSAGLEEEGYAVGAAIIGAHSVGAPHIRQRLYWVADAQRGTAERQRFDLDAAALRAQGEARQQRVRADAGDGGSNCMADAMQPGRSEWRSVAGNGQTAGRGGMGDSDCGGLKDGRRQTTDEPPESGERTLCMEHASGAGFQGHGRLVEIRDSEGSEEANRDDRKGCFWDDGEWRVGADGKARLIKPGIEPMAYGVFGRMAIMRAARVGEATPKEHWYNREGALKGFGNAIVPQAAAAFIRAYMQCQTWPS